MDRELCSVVVLTAAGLLSEQIVEVVIAGNFWEC